MSSMETVIGRDRWDDAYLWRTLVDQGARVCLCQRLAGHGCLGDAGDTGGADPGAL